MLKCKGCAAKQQTIEALAEQVEWLRLQLGTPWLEKRKQAAQPEQSPAFSLESAPWMHEDEEDIRYMAEKGLIPQSAAQAALEQVGALNTDITFDV